MANPVHERIRARLAALDMTPEQASRAAGLDKTYLRKLFERPNSSPRAENVGALARALETSVADLLGGGEIPVPARRSIVELPPMPSDVPVMGTAAGSFLGSFQLESGPIDFVRRPPALANAQDVYAIFIEGASMEPEHRPGDLRFVHPHKPARIGDSVIVQTRNHEKDRIEAVIGHLVRRGEDVTIAKLNPPSTMKIKGGTVIAIHKVLTMNELFGM